MKKRFHLFAAAIAVLALVVTASVCRPAQGTDPSASAPTETATPASASPSTPTPAPTLNPYFADFAYKRRIVLDTAGIKGAFTDFPVLITEANLDADFFDHAQKSAAGNMDIVFSDENQTTRLDREITVFDRGNRRFEAWVRMPSLSASAHVLYLHYGYAAANEPNDATAWGSGFAAVWHAQQSPAGAANDIVDSSVNANHGTSHNMNGSNLVSGKIGSALSFNGTDEYLSRASTPSLLISGSITLSVWVKLGNTGLASYINAFGKKAAWNGANGYALSLNPASNSIRLYGGGGDFCEASYLFDGGWHYIMACAAGSTASIFVDGVDLTSDGSIGPLLSDAQTLSLGNNSMGSGYFNGLLDELRIQTVRRDAAWSVTEYNNQSDPAAFYSVDPEIQN